MRSMKWMIVTVVIVLVIIAIPVVQFLRPIPVFTVSAASGAATEHIPGTAPKISWPTQGQAALLAVGVGELGQSGDQTPTPIASVTKVMTAYLVLQKHPLGIGQDGPTITVTKADYQTYLSDNAKKESVLPVKVGEKLTERQALEGLLLPSGNNVATMLANWIDGSETAFVQDMNQTAKQMGLTNTHYADASGYSPQSDSTAVDEVKLFATAMGNQAFKSVVSEAQATLPVANVVYNVNYMLGHGGIIGGKTGSTSQAGGCFVFASEKSVGGQKVLIVGAVLGQTANPALMTALGDGVKLSQEAQASLHPIQVVSATDPVATIQAPWMNEETVQAGTSVEMIGWSGMPVQKTLQAAGTVAHQASANETIATLTVTAGQQKKQIPIKTPTAIAGPNLLWRLKRL